MEASLLIKPAILEQSRNDRIPRLKGLRQRSVPLESRMGEYEMPTQHIGFSALCESGSAYSMAECHERTQDQPAGFASTFLPPSAPPFGQCPKETLILEFTYPNRYFNIIINSPLSAGLRPGFQVYPCLRRSLSYGWTLCSMTFLGSPFMSVGEPD